MQIRLEGSLARAAALVLGVVVLAACGRKEESGTAASRAADPSPVPAAAEPTTAVAAATPAADPVADSAGGDVQPGTITKQMVALGDSIFHGKAANGICFSCHGADAKGTQLAPSLGPHKWLTGDGSYAFLVKRITEGVPTPVAPYVTSMPPMGGSQLTPAQVNAVAAYIYSLSHKVG